MNNELQFLDLTYDFTIKSLWLKGSPGTKHILKRCFGALAHVNPEHFVEFPEELGGKKSSDRHLRVDIAYINKDKTKILNVEMNKFDTPSKINRTNAYVFGLASGIYGHDDTLTYEESFKEKKQTIQVCLNNYLHKTKKEQKVGKYMLTEQETYEIEDDVIIYRYYLPNYRISCYNNINEEPIEVKFLAMLSANSYEDLDTIVKGEKELETMVDDLKTFARNPIYMSEWEEKALHESEKSDMYDIGVAEGKKEVAKGMLDEKLDINLISRITGLSVEDINSLKTEQA